MHPALTRDCTKPRLFLWEGAWWCALDEAGTDESVCVCAESPVAAWHLAHGLMYSNALAGLRAGQLPARVS